jgi:hypothetical protein
VKTEFESAINCETGQSGCLSAAAVAQAEATGAVKFKISDCRLQIAALQSF